MARLRSVGTAPGEVGGERARVCALLHWRWLLYRGQRIFRDAPKMPDWIYDVACWSPQPNWGSAREIPTADFAYALAAFTAWLRDNGFDRIAEAEHGKPTLWPPNDDR